MSATATPFGALNAGHWSLWCRACHWRSEPVPVGPDRTSFHTARAGAEQAWRDHHQQGHEHMTEGAPADRLVEVGSAPPAIFPEVA